MNCRECATFLDEYFDGTLEQTRARPSSSTCRDARIACGIWNRTGPR